jgi:hypothetical protein
MRINFRTTKGDPSTTLPQGQRPAQRPHCMQLFNVSPPMAAMAWFTSKKGITDINGLLFKYDGLVKSPKAPIFVIPAKAGIQSFQLVKILLDPGFHRGDDFLRVHQVLVKRFLEKSSIGKFYHKINKFNKIRIPIRVKSLP